MKIFLDMDGTIAKFNVPNALNNFDKKVGFFSNLGAYKNIEIINELAKAGVIYIISASPNFQADFDKMIWLMQYLPNIPIDNITICRIGDNKAEIIQNKYNIDLVDCYLLDDYTKNLIEWENYGGIGIKRITTAADNSTKKWQGLELKDLKDLLNIIFDIDIL